MPTPIPFLSVIVPARADEPTLARCLQALASSDLPRHSWELVVVLDGMAASAMALAAAEHAQVVVRLPGPPRGAPYARNRGVEACRGQVLAFVSAKVCVERDTLRRLAELLVAHPDAGAVCATYEPPRPASGAFTTFFHLRELYRHGPGVGDTDVFPAGCAMIRREAFEAAGGWDEWRMRLPRIEAHEFGLRLRGLGHRILASGDVRVTHLKQYTVRRALVSTVVDHGLPYEDIPAPPVEIANPRLRRIRLAERACRWLSWGTLALLGAAAIARRPAVPALGAATLALAHLSLLAPMYRLFYQERGVPAALLAIPLGFINALLSGLAVLYGGMIRALIGEPRPGAVVEAFAEVGVEVWPPVPLRRQPPAPAPSVRAAES